MKYIKRLCGFKQGIFQNNAGSEQCLMTCFFHYNYSSPPGAHFDQTSLKKKKDDFNSFYEKDSGKK